MFKDRQIDVGLAKFWTKDGLKTSLNAVVKHSTIYRKNIQRHMTTIQALEKKRQDEIEKIEALYRKLKNEENESHAAVQKECTTIIDSLVKELIERHGVEPTTSGSRSWRDAEAGDCHKLTSKFVSLRALGFNEEADVRWNNNSCDMMRVKPMAYEKIENSVIGELKEEAFLVVETGNKLHEANNQLLLAMMVNEDDREAINKELQAIGLLKGTAMKRIKQLNRVPEPIIPCAVK